MGGKPGRKASSWRVGTFSVAQFCNLRRPKVLTTLISIYTGWSFGGVVAFEVARQLLQENNLETKSLVRGVMLIDSPCPVQHVPLSSEIIDAVLASAHSELPSTTFSSSAGWKKEVLRLVRRQFEYNARLLSEYGSALRNCESEHEVDDPVLGSFPPLVLLRSKQGFRSPKIPSKDVPEWLRGRKSLKAGVDGWEGLAGRDKVKVLDIPGDHFSVFKDENVSDLFDCLQTSAPS